MRYFKIPTQPYHRKLYKKANININTGVTVLVGCNGSGKTTLLKLIHEDLDKKNIPILYFDNQSYDVQNATEKAMIKHDMDFLSALLRSSEGERICLNLNKFIEKVDYFIKNNGETPSDSTPNLFDTLFNNKDILTSDEKTHTRFSSNEYWILIDAADSGLSIDNIIDMKNIIDIIIKEGKKIGVDIYVLISANEYEMCINEPCFNIQSGRYIDISSYDEYKKIILESREYKNKNIRYHRKDKK